MAKLFSGEKYTQDAIALMELVGPVALLEHGAPGAPAAGAFAAACREVPVTTIYGGSSEILRSLIAEAGLGLPRSR
jgi:alkylation response protein AidB-like acyl-CoA dehydrogenase